MPPAKGGGMEIKMKDLVYKFFHKYKSISVQAKAALWFTLCNIVQKGISTVTVPIFTRIMSTEQYGVYTIYLSWQSVLLIFTSLNLYYGVFNNAMIRFKDDRSRYISSMQGLTLTITSFFFIIYLGFRNQINEWVGMNTLLMILLFVQLFSMPPLLFWSARQRFEFRYKLLVGVTLLKAILNPLLGVLAVLLSDNKDIARIFTIVFVELCIGIVIATSQFMKGKSFYNKSYWKYAFFFNFPLLPHYLSGTILNQADRIMIGKMIGNSQAALYAVVYNIGMLMLLFTDAINNSFTPWMYQKMKDKNFVEIKKLGNSLVSIIATLVVLMLFFAPEVLTIFASKEYADALYVIPPVVVTTFFVFVYVMYANIEFYYEENKMIMVASILAALLNLLLNYLFIPIYGYYAAAYTTLICYIIYTFSHYIFSSIVLKKHEGLNSIFDHRFIFFLSVLLLVIMVVFNYLYANRWLRYGLLVSLLMGIIINRNKVIMIIKSIREK